MSKNHKPKKIAPLLLSVLVIVVTVVLLSRWLSKPVEAAWYNDSWQYRTKITITNTGAAVTNQKVKFDIATDALVTAGKIQSDCGDSRFVSSTGEILRYYLDTGGGACNTNSTDYYVLIPSINAGSVVLYHYYGNMAMANGTEGANFSESTFSPNTSSAASEEQSVAPIAYWKFDEKGGSTASDATGQGNTGTLTSAVWNPRENCLVNNCLMFTGSNSFVTTSLQVSPAQYTSLTMMAWVRPIDVQGAYGNIMGGDDGGYDRSFGFTTSQFQVQVGNQGWTPGVNADIGKWQHVAVVYSPSQITFYKNGVASHYNSGGSFGTSVQGLEIGKDSACGGCYFKGYMDEAKVYGRALTASEVLQAYKKPGETGPVSAAMSQNAVDANGPSFLSDGLVGYWHLDESSGNYFDYTGNGLTITDNGTTLGAAGKYGLGRDFNGTSQYGTVADSSTLDLPVTANRITVSAWINWDGNGFTDAGVITRKLTASGAGAAPWGVHDLYLTTSNKMAFRITDGVNGGSESIAIGNTTISSGTWYHVVGTYDGSNVRIFVNGVQDGISSTTLTMGNTAHPFLIGKDTISSNGNNFNGKIDDLRLYNRAFPSTDVATLYAFRPTPLVYWNLDEGTGTTANEPNGYNGTAVVNAWTQGKYGKALAMNGTTQYIQNTAVTAFNPAYAFTLEFWVYSTVDSGSIIWGEISSGTTCNGNPQIWKDGSNNITLGRCGNGAGPNVGPSSAFLNGWHHVAFSYDGTNTYAYKNGVLMSTYTFTWPSIASSKFRMGADRDTVLTGLLTGKLDEVRLYNYARTQKEIVSDMNGGHANVGSPVGSAIGHWKFDEGADNTCLGGTNDVCNSGNAGSTFDAAQSGMAVPATSTSGWTNSGKFNKGLNFDGANDYVVVTDTAALRPGNESWSMSVWAKPGNSNQSSPFITKRQNTGDVEQYRLDICGDIGCSVSGQNLLAVFRESETVERRALSTIDVADGNWHYYAMVADKAANKIKIYMDGVELNQTSISDGAWPTVNNTDNLRFGNDNGTLYYNNSLDEVKIYNFALSPDEIKLDFNRGSSIVLGVEDTGSKLADGAGNAAVGEWRFEEKASTNTVDTSGQGNSAALTSTAWTRGKFGNGLKFNGTTSQAVVADPASGALDFGDGQAFSVFGWFRSTDPTSEMYLIDKRVSGGNSAGYLILLDQDATNYWGPADGTNGGHASNTANYSDGKWHHTGFTFDGTSVTTAYVDGQVVATTTQALGSTANAASLYFGRLAVTNTSYFNGDMDEIKIYNYRLTQAQVAQQYNRGAPVGYWKFDECQGDTAFDSAPNSNDGFNGNNGTLTPGAGSNTTVGSCNSGTSTEMWNDGTTGKINASVGFDGSDDYVTIADPASGILDFTSGAKFTITGWFRTSSFSSVQTLVAKKTGNTAGAAGLLINVTAGQKLNAFISDGTNQFFRPSVNTLATDTWYHFAFVFDNSDVTASTFWINGIRENGTATGTIGNVASIANSQPFVIGAESDFGSPFVGQIDEVGIYNYALSSTQIKEIMNNGGIYFGPTTGTP